MTEASPEMMKYFDSIETEVAHQYKVAGEARKKGHDPEKKVDIPLAKGMAQRVEGLVSAVVPELQNSGVAERILELEKTYGLLDWRVALKIAEEVALEKFIKFPERVRALETGIRVGLAYITLGVISAPLEGFIELKIKKRMDGKEYVSAFFAGPIRAAGGTAQAVSLIITDYVRLKCGIDKYDPTEKEVKRYVTELRDYHERVSNLQYFPSEEEITFLIKHLPVEVNGDPTEKIEVSNYKDLERVETNMIRGGICLVVGEGLAQKAPKLYKQIKKWGKEMGLEWDFMSEFLDIQKRIKSKGEVKKDNPTITPNYTFIKDLVAGRPVLSFPMRFGGFRLRYGRTRTTGLAAAAIHPNTMFVLDDFIATGSQIKVERPGKAAAIVVCDSIDGPIIKTKDGSVIFLDNATPHPKKEEIERILFLGDILFNYGDFSENNHKLVPPGYCPEWWALELKKAIMLKDQEFNLNRSASQSGVALESLENIFKDTIMARIKVKESIALSRVYNVPLHPSFTYYWTGISTQEFISLLKWMKTGKVIEEDGNALKIVIKVSIEKELLEKIGCPHLLVNKEFVVIEHEYAHTINELLLKAAPFDEAATAAKPILTALSDITGITIKDKAGIFIGARMGRPEKAKMRKLTGSPHMLFPVAEQGGRMRSVQAALEAGKITADFPVRLCTTCKQERIYSVCEVCGSDTLKGYYCVKCGTILEKCPHEPKEYKRRDADIKQLFNAAIAKGRLTIFPDLIKGVRGTSNKDHTPEHLLKGILRAKHGIYVNKDGTTRYDMIEVPITHFRPLEVGTSIEKLHEMGYLLDTHGKPLVSLDQVCELKPQDIILPAANVSSDEPADETLFKVANFIDELLVTLYDQPSYYNLKNKRDIVGHLIVGLAPHTSAGTVGRIVGFSRTQGMFTHPIFHAAMRRNCDGDEACAMLLMDSLLNFSRSFLPDRRGSRTMDAPLVLTSLLVPGEVDDEVHGIDIAWSYPLEFYETACQFKSAGDVKILQLDHVLNTPQQYEGMGYTHEVTNINMGVLCSAYKTLPTMEDKLKGQMGLAEKIAAVSASEVAQLVIEKHFIKDIKGNLRKFSTQQFRCVSCNTKFRRPPMLGKCSACNGKIIFTISEGSVVKYLEPTMSLARTYKVTSYLQQTLDFLQKQVDSVMGKEKEKQEGLGKWFG